MICAMEPRSESARRLPDHRLSGLIGWYSGYAQAGAPPARHRGLPSPWLAFILTLDDPLEIAVHPDRRQQVDGFGFEATVVYEDGDQVTHAELAWPPGGGVMIGSARDGDELAQRPGTTACYVVTDDPDRLHDRAAAAGAQIVRPLHDTDHGSRDFTATDPEGNTWSFGTYRGHPRR